MINELSANELSVNYPSSRQGALDVDDGQSLQVRILYSLFHV